MADIRAAQSGDFSLTSTWVGGVVPGSGDIAYSNTFTVTISDTRTVQAISNATGTSINVGGSFSLLNGCNLTCTNANGVLQGATATPCIITSSLSAGSSATVTSAMSHTVSTAGSTAIALSGGGAFTWIGALVGPTSANVPLITLSGSGSVIFTGNMTGSTISNGNLIAHNGTGSITITGNITALSASNVIQIQNSSTGSITINGNVTGGTGAAAAVVNFSSGTLTVNGVCQSGTVGPAIGAGSASQITRLSGPFLLGASGAINPVVAVSWRWTPTQIPTYYEAVASNGTTKRNLFTSDNIPTSNYPVATNVRSGIVYGPNLENTGTLAVPAVGSVALGVAVDNTVGTAVLTSANVQTALGQFSSGRLSNVATVDSTGAQIQAAVSA